MCADTSGARRDGALIERDGRTYVVLIEACEPGQASTCPAEDWVLVSVEPLRIGAGAICQQRLRGDSDLIATINGLCDQVRSAAADPF